MLSKQPWTTVWDPILKNKNDWTITYFSFVTLVCIVINKTYFVLSLESREDTQFVIQHSWITELHCRENLPRWQHSGPVAAWYSNFLYNVQCDIWEGSACGNQNALIHILSCASIPNKPKTFDLIADIETGSELNELSMFLHCAQSKYNVHTNYTFWIWPKEIISRLWSMYAFWILFSSLHGLYQLIDIF